MPESLSPGYTDLSLYSRRLRLAAWLFYAAILLATALPHGMRTVLTPRYPCSSAALAQDSHCTPRALNPAATNAKIIRVMDGTDAAFIARRARDIVQTRDWRHLSLWPLWPPGMVVIQTGLYALSPALPVGLCLMVIDALAWGAVCAQLAFMLPRWIPVGPRFLLPLLILMYGLFPYLFQLGVFYTESLSIALFLLGIGRLTQSLDTGRVMLAVEAGTWLAASSYMRAQTDLVMSIALVGFVVLGAITVTLSRVMKERNAACKLLLRLLLAMFLAYHALTLPYRAAHDMRWIALTGNPLWRAVWMAPESLTPDLQFYADGGALAGCNVDPVTCTLLHAHEAAHLQPAYGAEDYFHFTLSSFLHRPWAWLRFKFGYLRVFWLDGAPAAMFATLMLPGLFFAIRRRPDAVNLMLGYMLIATGAAVMGPFLLMHIEERYMTQFKLLILYAAGLVFARTLPKGSS